MSNIHHHNIILIWKKELLLLWQQRLQLLLTIRARTTPEVSPIKIFIDLH